MPVLELSLFGGLDIQLHQQPVTSLVSRKANALAVYLACNAQRYPREVIADLLWDERSQSQAMGNLRVVLNSLRRELKSLITITRQTVHIQRSAQLWVDSLEFEQLLACMRATPLAPANVSAVQRALALYKGEFLAGFFLRDAHQFDEWVLFERERYQILAVNAARQLTAYYVDRQEKRQGIQAAQRWVQLDPLNEDAHRHMMELLIQDGQRTAAVEHYQQHLSKMIREGLELSGEFNAFYQRLTRDELSFQVEELQRSTATPGRTAAVVPHNLPSPLMPIIGRAAELEQIQKRLEDPACRLLTVMGLGGVGKTRLAIEAALTLATAPAGAEHFADGIYLVRLDRFGPEQLLPSMIASAINFQFQGPLDQVKQLLQYLRHRQMLLILDNFEHLLHYSDLLLEILHQAPDVKLLITSRVRLEFMGEWLLTVEGLPCPTLNPTARTATDANPALIPADWEEYPATSLFILTAQSIQSAFRPQRAAASIIQICQLVDGLPLAIQLAAAAVHLHRCDEIADALQRNLDFINTNMRNLPERHRGLRAIFNHSWHLLADAEKAAFVNLAVFAGGFSEEQAQTVADIPNVTLVQLLNQSLIQPAEELAEEEPRATPSRRYRMHPILHQYAHEILVTDATNAALRYQRHSQYFCDFVITQGARLSSAAAASAVTALGHELDNLHAAWNYALAQQTYVLLQRMLPPLIRFYLLRGFLQDALALLDHAITEAKAAAAAGDALAQEAHWFLAYLWAYQAEILSEVGRYDAAIAAARAAIEIADRSADLAAQALGYLQWGIALNYQGSYRPAKERLQQCLVLAQEQEYDVVEATAHRYLGVNCFYQGDYTAGRLHHESAIRLHQANHDLTDELRTYHSLAMLYFYTGDYLQARQHYERCRRAYSDIGDRTTLSLTLNNLGAVSSHLGDYPTALRSFEDALTIRRQIGDRQMEGLILANMGLLMHLMNNNRLALTYCMQALEVSLEIGERDTEAYARTCLGHTLLELGRVTEAIANYEQAVAIRQGNGQLTQMLEPMAGLARAQLRGQDTAAAQALVEEILPHLNIHTYAGIVELIRIYLTCYRVLYLIDDPRAQEILRMGYQILQERAAKITDKTLHKYYLDNIIAHRELLTEYETHLAA